MPHFRGFSTPFFARGGGEGAHRYMKIAVRGEDFIVTCKSPTEETVKCSYFQLKYENLTSNTTILASPRSVIYM